MVDVFLRPYSVGTFSPNSPTRHREHLAEPLELEFEGPKFYTYSYQDVSKASSDHCENLVSLLGSCHASNSCDYKVSRHYLWRHNIKTERAPLPNVMPRLSIKIIAFPNLTKAIYPTHILIVRWQHGRNCLQFKLRLATNSNSATHKDDQNYMITRSNKSEMT